MWGDCFYCFLGVEKEKTKHCLFVEKKGKKRKYHILVNWQSHFNADQTCVGVLKKETENQKLKTKILTPMKKTDSDSMGLKVAHDYQGRLKNNEIKKVK